MKNYNARTLKCEAIKSLKLKLRPTRIMLKCSVDNCKKDVPNERTTFCHWHKKDIRREQLRLNNITWKRRVKKGTAKHHLTYRREATEWAVVHPADALAKAKKGYGELPPVELAEAISKARQKY